MRLPNDRTPARVTKYVLLIAGLVIAATLTGFPARVLSSYEVNQRVLALEQRLAARQAENESLQHELARRHTEAYIRTMAKERLGLGWSRVKSWCYSPWMGSVRIPPWKKPVSLSKTC